MEKTRLVFMQMIVIVLNVIAMVLILFTDAFINQKILIEFVLALAMAMLLILTWLIASQKS